MKRRHAHDAISAEERIARYAYVLGTVPVSVADRAYAAAFAPLSPEQREDVLSQLQAELAGVREVPASADPVEFAVLMRDLLLRDAIVRTRDCDALADAFVHSPPVVAYFTSGTGSLAMDHQPPWIHELAGHETAPIDAGRKNHRPGIPGFTSLGKEKTGDASDW